MVKKIAKKKTKSNADNSNADSKSLNVSFLKKKNKKKLLFKIASKNRKKLIISATFIVILFAAFKFQSLFLAASVNGKLITRYSLDKQLESLYGQQVLEDLITKEIIKQEAQSQNITVGEEEVKEVIANLRETLESQNTTLEDALAFQGQSMEELGENIRVQKMVEKLIADKIAVADEDVLGYYDENDGIYEDKDFDDVKDEIRRQLEAEVLSNEASKWLTEIKDKANVKFFLPR